MNRARCVRREDPSLLSPRAVSRLHICTGVVGLGGNLDPVQEPQLDQGAIFCTVDGTNTMMDIGVELDAIWSYMLHQEPRQEGEAVLIAVRVRTCRINMCTNMYYICTCVKSGSILYM